MHAIPCACMLLETWGHGCIHQRRTGWEPQGGVRVAAGPAAPVQPGPHGPALRLASAPPDAAPPARVPPPGAPPLPPAGCWRHPVRAGWRCGWEGRGVSGCGTCACMWPCASAVPGKGMAGVSGRGLTCADVRMCAHVIAWQCLCHHLNMSASTWQHLWSRPGRLGLTGSLHHACSHPPVHAVLASVPPEGHQVVCLFP